jgi:hypothetical protein
VTNLLHTAKCSIDRSLLPPGGPGRPEISWEPER